MGLLFCLALKMNNAPSDFDIKKQFKINNETIGKRFTKKISKFSDKIIYRENKKILSKYLKIAI